MKAKEFIIELKKESKPRNFVAKNVSLAGKAGQHKDKKKAEKQGDVKHKKELATMESQGVAEGSLNEFAPSGNSASSYYAVTANFVNDFAQQKQEELQDLIDAGWTKQDLAQAGTLESHESDIAHFEQVRDGFLKGLKPGFDAYLQGDTQLKDQLGSYWQENDLPLNQDWEKIYGEPWGRDEYDEGVAEGPNDGSEDNFTIDDIKRLEKIQDFETLKAQAKQLIKGKPARRMKPEKISFFYNRVDTLRNPLAVIKMMYDMMLAGEGNRVIGSRNSMSSNSYRQRFGEQGVAEVSLGDYREKALKQKAQSQMGAMFNKDSEKQKQDLATFNKRERGLNRLKARDEVARKTTADKQMADNIAKLPELKAEYERMKAEYKLLGGSNWQYADREQNLTDRERKARSMEGPMNNLWRTISAAEKAQKSQGVEEGVGSKLASLGLAGAMAFGASGASARVMPGDDPSINRLTGKPIATQQATDNNSAKAEAPKGYNKEYLQKAADPNRIGRYMMSVEKAQELLKQMDSKVGEGSMFAGVKVGHKEGPAGQWRNDGPKKNKPARPGDLVGGGM